MNEDIDIIVYWVDGNDPKWQQKRSEYKLDSSSDAGKNRYRDMGTLKYLFRGIEKFAPWVRKVFFVTDGQIPTWLNKASDKLQIVDHKDYIPAKYLPVFSSHPIELNFHRIEGLSDKFVVMNDDFFLTAPTEENDFFQHGLPVDILTEMPLQFKSDHVYNRILFNNFDTIGKYYSSRKEYKRRLRNKMLSTRYGVYFFYNLMAYLLPYQGVWGINTPHMMRPYLKKDFIETWEKEGVLLDETCSHKFRSKDDVSIYLIRLFNLMQGEFVPGNIYKKGKAYVMTGMDCAVFEAIRKKKYKFICINDECDDSQFDACCSKLIKEFDGILPDKSMFEL